MKEWCSREGRVFAAKCGVTVMGIVNTTPDSFSDGGIVSIENLWDRVRQLVAAGADLIDIGGESSRPGAQPVPLEEELMRVLPAVEAAASAVEVPISIDTAKPEVARRAVAAGAAIVNSIRGSHQDPEIDELVASTGCGVVLMHMKGDPTTMQDDPRYDDVVGEVLDALAARIERLVRLGVDRRQIAVDPGIGFGKTTKHNAELLCRLADLQSLGCAILVGTSRKRFLGKLQGSDSADRLGATIASCLWAVERGAQIVRVHDVAQASSALSVWKALGEYALPPMQKEKPHEPA